MGWKLKVAGYEKIESAEIEMAPLTLFVGDNNSGKSYLMSLLWGILNLEEVFAGTGSALETEAEEWLLHWVKEQMETAREQGGHTVQASEIGSELQTVLQARIECHKDKLVKAIFNSADVDIKELQIELTGLDDISIGFRAKTSEDKIIFSIRLGNDAKGYVTYFSEKGRMSEDLDESDWDFFVNNIFRFLLNEGRLRTLNKCIYLPAARTGFMLTKDVINKVGRRAAFNIGIETEPLPPFVRPINQFLDVINDLTLDGESNENFAEIVEYLESGMADGTVEMSSLPNKEVTYVPNGKTTGMSLRTVSAVVTELSPLILILKHKKNVGALFYEEPEMCLHPQLQQKMARVLCRLVNAGVQMNVTTHSDIILQHINNMIRLSGREDREEICHQLGYDSRDLLRPEEVKVYQLRAEAGEKTRVEELSCGKNGFAVPTFNDALDRIMDEAYVIQE